MKSCIIIAITLCLLGCGQDLDPATDNTVHLAGIVAAPSGTSVAGYWKDGVYTGLTNDTVSSSVHSLYVDGSSVLIGGYKWNRGGVPVFWQNGTETAIEGAFGGNNLFASHNNNLFGVWYDLSKSWVINKNGISQSIIDTAQNIGPNSLALLGDDLYIAGYALFHDGSGPNNPQYQNAQCWKNGQLIFRESVNSTASSIFIHQNDIYMAGHVFDIMGTTTTACYWKNGERVNLTTGNSIAIARSVFVTDTHVYAAGMINGQAVYWKDGVAVNLTTGGTYSIANSIFVKGTDVHIGGQEQGYPAYWKNDVKQTFVNQDKRGEIKFVVVGSN